MATKNNSLTIQQQDFDTTITNRHKLLPLYIAEERVLVAIFASYPRFDFAELMTRVTLLNQFYSTAISDIRGVVNHILEVPNVEDRLVAGDISVVEDIAKVSHRGKEWHHNSFASKFANFHNPDAFPIMDSLVLDLFCRLRRKGFFQTNTKFSHDGLRKNYAKYVEVYNELIALSGLNRLTWNGCPLNYKLIDNYLWSSLKIRSLDPNSPEAQAAPTAYQTICSNAINSI